MKQISANFGVIKDTVYVISAKELIAEHNKKNTLLNEFFKLIQENPILKVQYLIFKNLENGVAKKEHLAERYINQNLKLIEKFKWNDIVKTNKDVKLKLVGQFDSQAHEGKTELYESIHTLIKSVTKFDFNEIDKSQIAYDYIMEHLMKNNVEKTISTPSEEELDRPKFLSWKYVTDLAVSKFNENYSHLSEDERKLVKVLLSPMDNKLNYFKDLKNENLQSIESLLNENIDDLTKSACLKFKNKILSLNESTMQIAAIDEAIINLAELEHNLKQMGQDAGETE